MGHLAAPAASSGRRLVGGAAQAAGWAAQLVSRAAAGGSLPVNRAQPLQGGRPGDETSVATGPGGPGLSLGVDGGVAIEGDSLNAQAGVAMRVESAATAVRLVEGRNWALVARGDGEAQADIPGGGRAAAGGEGSVGCCCARAGDAMRTKDAAMAVRQAEGRIWASVARGDSEAQVDSLGGGCAAAGGEGSAGLVVARREAEGRADSESPAAMPPGSLAAAVSSGVGGGETLLWEERLLSWVGRGTVGLGARVTISCFNRVFRSGQRPDGLRVKGCHGAAPNMGALAGNGQHCVVRPWDGARRSTVGRQAGAAAKPPGGARTRTATGGGTGSDGAECVGGRRC